MIGRRTLRLVALFAVISVVGILYVSFRYVGAASLIGLGPYTVSVQLAEPGGIYPDASVSYRGVEIGKVGQMRVIPSGVEVDLEIQQDTSPIPASAVAVVANRSAIGEQYVDLRPTTNGAPYLEEGSVIPQERTRTGVPEDKLLADLNALANSVPLPELRTTVDELFVAFDRTGPDLQRLLDSGNLLVADAIRNLPPTTELLRDGRVVLDTQSRLGPQIRSFSRDLQLFTDQLRRDDPNLRRLVNAAPPAAAQLEGLIRETGPALSRTIANLLTVARIVQPRLAGLEQFLVTYPAIAAAAPSVVPGDGRVHFGLVMNVNDPPPCRNGYLQPDAGWRPATALDFPPLNTNARCNEGPPINVRGAQNAPAPSGGPSRGPATAGGTGSGENGPPTEVLTSLPPGGVLSGGEDGAPPVVIPGMTG